MNVEVMSRGELLSKLRDVTLRKKGLPITYKTIKDNYQNEENLPRRVRFHYRAL